MSHLSLRNPLPVLAFLGALVLGASCAEADVIVLHDGTTVPKGLAMKVGEAPGEEDLEKSASTTVDLAYDVVKAGGKEYPAGQVVEVYVREAEGNANFRDGEIRAESRFWQEASESYAAAAEELKGAAKQVALYKRILCLANLGDADATFEAAEAMLAEFPKSFFFGPVQQKRALILASKGKMDDAVGALKTVTGAAGMNARDYFEAEYLRVWLTKMLPARTTADFGQAEKEFRAVLEAIDRNPRGKVDAADQRMKAVARVAKALVLQNKPTDARTLVDQAIAGADRGAEKAALAAAYGARGDALYMLGKQAQDGGKKDEARKLAEDASLDYLRVATLYADSAEASDVFNATQSVARVFRNLFALSGEKDCELARRAYDWYVTAAGMLDQGEEKRTLVREGLSLKEAMDKACGTGEKTEGPPAKPGDK